MVSGKNILISVIILDWNGSVDQCRKCLKSAVSQKYVNKEILFIDNGSDTIVYDQLCSEFLDVCFYKLEQNLGCAEGRNWGARKANGDILVFLENDGYWESDDVIPRMVAYFSKYELLGVLYTSVKGPNNHDKDIPADGLKKYTHEVDTISSLFRGGACAIRKKVFFDCGGFPGFYFRQGEEEWLSYKIYESGFYILYVPSIELLHFGSDYTGKDNIVSLNNVKNNLITRIRLFPIGLAFKYVFPRLIYRLVSFILRGRFADALNLLISVNRELLRRRKTETVSKETVLKMHEIRTSQDAAIIDYSRMHQNKDNFQSQ